MRVLIVHFLRRILGSIFGPAFGSRQLSPKIAMACALTQKLLRINGDTPWPVHWTSTVKSPALIDRGTRFPGLSKNCHIDGRNGIRFGNNVWVGPHVTIVSMNHSPLDYHEYVAQEPIVIGDNCWIGAHSVILPSVQLGDHTIVAAGSVVVKSFPQGDCVIAGNPARIVKQIATYEGLGDKCDD